mgnify:CR=1 FL=1
MSISQVISRDSRNRPEFPTEGSKFLWSSTFSGSLLGGNESYHKQVFSFDWYSPVYNEIVMFQNFKFGALLELDDNQFIPYSARFVMGGTGIPYGEMLRGYVDNGIGPKKISSGYLSSDGGKIMVKYSMELRYKFSDSPTIYGLIFGDAGNVWENFETVDIFNLKRGDKVTVSGPYGEFFIKDSNREMIYIGGGAGMAPMRSHLFNIFHTLRTGRKVSFWYGARAKREMFYDEEFKDIQKKFPNFSYTVALSEPMEEDKWTGHTGFIHQVLHDEYLEKHEDPTEL